MLYVAEYKTFIMLHEIQPQRERKKKTKLEREGDTAEGSKGESK
jgi:hypothetical protein